MEGNYLFQLMVTDNDGATGVDTVSVIVNPSLIQTLIVNPSNNPFEMQLAVEGSQDVTGNGGKDMPIEAWTRNGSNLTIREVLKFDLSTIPANATITSATLSIYSDPNPNNGNLIDANFGSNNSMFVQQVTSNWSPSSIGWFNQPAVNTNNQIEIPSTASAFLDLNIDVTALVSSMITSNANYGFMLRLQNEVIYNSRIFCSSFHTETSKHPKLTVIYTAN